MDIVEEIRQDREKGAKRLAAEYQAGLLALACRFCHDPGDAEELVNRTFAAAVNGIDGFLAQSSFFTWMCQIMVHIHGNDNRRKSRENEVFPGDVPDLPDESSDGQVYRALDAALLRDAIETLPPDMKKTLMMHYFMDIPVAEIAKVLSVPTGTVKWRLHHARLALAAKLGAAAKKPGGKALLVALALCGLTALGAAVWSLGGREAAETVWTGGTGGTSEGTGETGGTCRTSEGTGETGGISATGDGAGGTGATGATDASPARPASPASPSVSDLQLQPTEQTKEITNMNATTLRTLAASAAFAAASAATLAPAPTMAGSVYDDAKVWFRGGYDANGDGVFAASEFVDSARSKSDAAHQTVTIAGKGAAYGHGPVWSAFNPFYTNTQYYVSLTNGDCAAAADCAAVKIVNPLEEGETWSRFTVFVRFRWDGKFAPGSNNKFFLLDAGRDYAKQKGFQFGFKYFPATGDFAPCWEVGSIAGDANNKFDPSATAGIKIRAGEWQDIMITVVDNGVGSNAYIEVTRGANGNVAYITSQNVFLYAWQQNARRANRVGLADTDNIKIGTESFSGDIAAFAVWPRKLSHGDSSYVEIREAMADPRPGDALFRIGKEDGKSDEFAASGSARYAVDANGTWDVVPPSLDAVHGTLTMNFDVPSGWANLNQILRLVAASGDGWIEGTVADAVRGTSARLKARILRPGHPADFFVPKDVLQPGPHTLTLRLTQGAGVTFDVIEMRGSFQLGEIAAGWTADKPFAANPSQATYNVVNGCWREMNAELSNDTLFDPQAANYDTENTDATTVFFNVPEDLVCCRYVIAVAYLQFENSKVDHVRWYLNNAMIHHSENLWQFTMESEALPADSFAAGLNAIKLRRTSSSASWWGVIRGLALHIQEAPPPDPIATILFVR